MTPRCELSDLMVNGDGHLFYWSDGSPIYVYQLKHDQYGIYWTGKLIPVKWPWRATT